MSSNEEENLFVFIKDNKYMSIDDSCGYPYWVDSISRAKFFTSIDKANEYYQHLKKENWTLVKVKFTLLEVAG